MLLEVRNENMQEVRFSAFDYRTNHFLWRDVAILQSWWVGMAAATTDVLLLNLYLSTENPDNKALVAFQIHTRTILWRKDSFSFARLDGNSNVAGHNLAGELEPVTVHLQTGLPIANETIKHPLAETIAVTKPFQYADDQPYFETVKSFVAQKLQVTPLHRVEYLEYNNFVFVSYYVQEGGLANYLIGVNENGEIVLHEKLGDALKGVGFETFFVLDQCLFFIRNKCELVSFRITAV